MLISCLCTFPASVELDSTVGEYISSLVASLISLQYSRYSYIWGWFLYSDTDESCRTNKNIFICCLAYFVLLSDGLSRVILAGFLISEAELCGESIYQRGSFVLSSRGDTQIRGRNQQDEMLLNVILQLRTFGSSTVYTVLHRKHQHRLGLFV